MRRLAVAAERWPLARTFTISRGSKTETVVVTVTLAAGGAVGRGEAVPYARYGESVEGVIAAIEGLRPRLEGGLDRTELQAALPPGAARNAVDCALWDLAAKEAGRSVAALAGLPGPKPVTTAYTLSLDSAAAMGAAARAEAARPVLKLKVGGADDLDRIRAVHEGAPQARLILDANEGWNEADYRRLTPALAPLGVELIEQPFPADRDAVLADLPHPIPVCADESCHDRASLARLRGRYDAINVKLDKTGGLTEGLALVAAARAEGLDIMVGSMVATSLAIAPAILLAQQATW
ncbi:MAG TPA: N-acetyl-D-Glu racemase DgcA, partial [Kofleriaceae bacterium]|nr:N-acetyl-D-Glu racemase DgcA [Kofleriaceae bacterium]